MEAWVVADVGQGAGVCSGCAKGVGCRWPQALEMCVMSLALRWA